MARLDVKKLREDFPILKRLVRGKPLAYLDNAATSQKPRAVIQSLVDFYENHNANVHRGVHSLSEESTNMAEATRAKLAAFIGAPKPETLIFTRNATESINLVAHAWARKFPEGGRYRSIHGDGTPLQYRPLAAARIGTRDHPSSSCPSSRTGRSTWPRSSPCWPRAPSCSPLRRFPTRSGRSTRSLS